MYTSIGDQIRVARRSRGWSQKELARRVGTTERTVGTWERGGALNPAKLEALQETLEIQFRPSDSDRLLARALRVSSLDPAIDSERAVIVIRSNDDQRMGEVLQDLLRVRAELDAVIYKLGGDL